jgi:very-short-patch-repair endonuclease
MSSIDRLPYNNLYKKYSDENRKNLTLPERIVWFQLLNKSKLGFRFIRQFRVGDYILDFYCPYLKLNIELDGNSHEGKMVEKDMDRDGYLNNFGIKIVRLSNIDVLNNIDEVRNYLIFKIQDLNKNIVI